MSTGADWSGTITLACLVLIAVILGLAAWPWWVVTGAVAGVVVLVGLVWVLWLRDVNRASR